MDESILLKSIIKNTTDAVFVKDLQGRYIYVNDAASQYLGNKPEHIIGKDDYAFFSHDDALSIIEKDKEIFELEKVNTYEEYVTALNGGTVTFLSTKGPVFDEQGVKIGIFGIARNITGRKKDESKIQKNEKRWHSLFEILPVGVSIINAKGEITDLNNALCEKLQLSREKLLRGEYTNRKYLRADGTPMSVEEFPSNRAVAENKIIKNVEIRVITENGNEIWTDVCAAPLIDEGGTVTVTADITAYKVTEMKLKEKIEELNKLNSFMTSRELKMAQLKEEIEELRKKYHGNS